MANEKILVVDDDANICELLRLYLTKEGYQVTTAGDGEEGLEKFNQIKPDMVLLDVMMPRMDGLEVCRRIRKAGNTPVMMLTAKDSGHFADILAAASSNANTNVSMMGETFKYCAPIAGALGFSAEDTAEAIGLMANAGIKSSQA